MTNKGIEYLLTLKTDYDQMELNEIPDVIKLIRTGEPDSNATQVYVNMLDPDPAAINWSGMGHRLESLTRWGGHSACRISLALHAVAVMSEFAKQNPKATEIDKIYALNHDTHEVFLSDIPTPVINAIDMLNPGTKEAVAELKATWDKAIWESLALPCPSEAVIAEIKKADAEVAQHEFEAIKAELPAHKYLGGSAANIYDHQMAAFLRTHAT